MTRQICVGGVKIGGGAPVSIQSMTNTPTHDVEATLAQIQALTAAGCEIVRLAVPDMAAARAIGAIKAGSSVPLVADIHFDYLLALEAVRQGIDKVRINPGNIGAPERVKAVAEACMDRSIPIRIGVNGGSLEKRLLEQYGGPTPEALVESGLRQAQMLEQFGFHDICTEILQCVHHDEGVPSDVGAVRLPSASGGDGGRHTGAGSHQVSGGHRGSAGPWNRGHLPGDADR